ncbi:MAG TPA: Ig-like domain-containing protein [bacterium]
MMKKFMVLIFAATLFASCEGPTGPAGAAGAKGDQGDGGTPGAPGPTLPSVTWVNPEPGDVDVALDTVIRASFTKAMNAATITPSTFTLATGSTSVAGTVSYNPGSKTAYFTPSASLSAFAYYTATLTTGVKDSEGNALSSAYTWSFTTGGSYAPSRLYVANINGSSITVYNNAGAANGNVFQDRIIVGGSTTLNAPNGIWIDSASDRLYISSQGNVSLLVFNNASTVTGNIAPARTITGANTLLDWNRELWLDSASDKLYVTNCAGNNILVFNNASIATGNIAPSRNISGGSTTLSCPSALWLDSASDRLYIANMGGNNILVFDSASTATGNIAPARTISGGLLEPADVWLDSLSDRLYVSNLSNNSVVVYNNASTATGAITPARTIAGANTTFNGTYGIWLDSSSDRLYVANVYNNSILVFNNASAADGNIAPSRTIVGANTALNYPVRLWLDSGQ